MLTTNRFLSVNALTWKFLTVGTCWERAVNCSVVFCLVIDIVFIFKEKKTKKWIYLKKVRCKECKRSHFTTDVFWNSPRQSKTIIRRRSTTLNEIKNPFSESLWLTPIEIGRTYQFIDDNQRFFCGCRQNGGGFQHLRHERWNAAQLRVTSTNTSKNRITNTNS